MNKFNIALGKLYTIFEDYKEIIAVYLYGSVARGDFSLRHSDLDLFVILNQKKPLKKSVEQINHLITNIAFQNGVNAHVEFQGTIIEDKDESLLKKIMEEGQLVYSRGFITFEKYKIGLKAFLFYKYTILKKKYRSRFSQILHGYSSSYYKSIHDKNKKEKGLEKNKNNMPKLEKVTKNYNGIINNKDIIEVGKGALMVSKEKEKYIKKLFEDYGAKYELVKMVYSE
ncbi:nucleotidyltransferase domain-containing protein [Candidatus Woesearchaeota archaeon]|nr:nucleotidyltransferase domain-containing protein [Candidatus Woesearchaeota archaeon]